MPVQGVRQILRGQQMSWMRYGRKPQIRGNVQVLQATHHDNRMKFAHKRHFQPF